VSGVILAIWGRDLLFQLADVIKVSSAPAGFVVHLVGSAAVGALFGLLLRDSVSSPSVGAVLGFMYGMAVWLVSPMTPLHTVENWWARAVPQFLTPPQMVKVTAASHGVFGLLLGASYSLFFGEKDAAPAAVAATAPRAEDAVVPAEDASTPGPDSGA